MYDLEQKQEEKPEEGKKYRNERGKSTGKKKQEHTKYVWTNAKCNMLPIRQISKKRMERICKKQIRNTEDEHFEDTSYSFSFFQTEKKHFFCV